MDSSLVVAVGIGFGVGSFGYILMRFYITPILAYRKLRKRIIDSLARVDKGCGEESVPTSLVPDVENLRFLAKALMDCHEDLLPTWYRIALVQKGEDPMAAATEMMAASNVRNGRHLKKRLTRIRECMHLG